MSDRRGRIILKPSKEPAVFSSLVAGLTSVTLTYPLLKINLRKIITNHELRKVAKYTAREGFSKFFRGMSPQMIQRTGTVAAMYIVHNKVVRFDQPVGKYELVVAGGIATATVDSLLMPFERVQAILVDRRYNNIFRNMQHVFRLLFGKYGIKECYRGFTVVSTRNLCAHSIFFWLWNEKQKALLRTNAEEHSTNSSSFIVTVLIGSFVSILTYPLNVTRVIMQKSIGTPYRCMTQEMRHIYFNHGGLVKFYDGCHIQLFRSFISWYIIAYTHKFYMNAYSYLK